MMEMWISGRLLHVKSSFREICAKNDTSSFEHYVVKKVSVSCEEF